MIIFATGLMIVGVALGLICSIWFLIVVFSNSIILGILTLIFPPVGLVVLFRDWKRARKPFFMHILSVLILFGGTFLFAGAQDVAGVKDMMINDVTGRVGFLRNNNVNIDGGSNATRVTGVLTPYGSVDDREASGNLGMNEDGQLEVERATENKTIVHSLQKNPNESLIDEIRMGETEHVKYLLEHGADVNTRTPEGLTALMEASAYGYTEIVRMLLAGGADLNAAGPRGETALSLAESNFRSEIAEILQNR